VFPEFAKLVAYVIWGSAMWVVLPQLEPMLFWKNGIIMPFFQKLA
jgi:hypothetical protein